MTAPKQENSLEKLQNFNIFKVILASITLTSFLLAFVSLVVTVAPHVLYPYTPYEASKSFSVFTDMLYLFTLAFSGGAFLGALIKKIKWRWVFIWFFTANFLGLGKETALYVTEKFPEVFNFTSIALYALACMMLCMYLLKRWFSEKTPRLPLHMNRSIFKQALIYAAFIFVIFWLVVLVSVYGSTNIKYNVSQTAIILLALTLPFCAATFIETMMKDKRLKPFMIFAALSLLFLALAALLSVPIDSPYDVI